MFLYITIDIFSHLDEIIAEQAVITNLFNYYLTMLPLIFIQTSPVAALLSLLYTLGTLSMHNEIIAMRNAGLSIIRITRPLILIGLLLSIVNFWLNESVMPYALKNQEYLKEEVFEKKEKDTPQDKPITNLAFYGRKNRLFFVNTFDINKTEMQGVVILQQDSIQNMVKKIVADKAKWEYDSWRFFRCYIYTFDASGQISGDPNYMESIKTDIEDSPEEIFRQKNKVASMDIFELFDYIQRLRHSGAEETVRNLKVDLYNKLTSPFVSMVIILAGIPFAITTRRGVGFFGSMGICVGISFLYYVTSAFSLALGKAGLLHPLLAASLPHILFILMGIILIRRHR
jgi:LPS export ABC transporter permease LptG